MKGQIRNSSTLAKSPFYNKDLQKHIFTMHLPIKLSNKYLLVDCYKKKTVSTVFYYS